MKEKQAIHWEDDLDTREISEDDRYREVLPVIRETYSKIMHRRPEEIVIDGDYLEFPSGHCLSLERRKRDFNYLDWVETRELWRWVVSITTYDSGTYWEPPSMDFCDIGVFDSFMDATTHIATCSVQEAFEQEWQGLALAKEFADEQ